MLCVLRFFPSLIKRHSSLVPWYRAHITTFWKISIDSLGRWSFSIIFNLWRNDWHIRMITEILSREYRDSSHNCIYIKLCLRRIQSYHEVLQYLWVRNQTSDHFFHFYLQSQWTVSISNRRENNGEWGERKHLQVWLQTNGRSEEKKMNQAHIVYIFPKL